MIESIPFKACTPELCFLHLFDRKIVLKKEDENERKTRMRDWEIRVILKERKTRMRAWEMRAILKIKNKKLETSKQILLL